MKQDTPSHLRLPSDNASSFSPLVCLNDYEVAAKKLMTVPAWDYMSGGAADEITLRRNQSAFDGIFLKPRILVDVSKIDMSQTLFGVATSHPIMLAPTASHMLVHPEGEVATAKGADMSGSIMVASTVSNRSIEEICQSTSKPVWFQLYVEDDLTGVKTLIQRAEMAGCRALCITVDNPFAFARYREERTRSQAPKLPFPNLGIVAGPGGGGRPRRRFSWKDLSWIQSFATTPIILKGVMNPEDAEEAVKHGVAGLVVSNHGGRALDTVPSTIEVLAAIVDRVAGRVPVLMDGGIRRGTDVLKALAFGASAVMIGRPYVYGLCVDGAQGVRSVVDILRGELEGAMAMTGRIRLDQIDRTVFWSRTDYRE